MKIYCRKCGREIKGGERCYKVTVGQLMTDWNPPYLNPSEAHYYVCVECMEGEDE